ncbi:MAG: site-2 protease family protein [Candidatus Nomurabacteria bacterium]|nr:MAG: site-2 protease family protein [Candidatus Nomurabacteria bacterium]HRV75803.1 site-2 protease family protein [Candidatus Saccharimonadales bacterium]
MNLTFTEIIIAVGVLAFSISIHESVHSIVAYFLGDRTSHSMGRFSLNPIHHIDPLTTVALPLILMIAGAPPFAAAKPVPINTHSLKGAEWGMALVGLAGPLSNLILAFVSSFILNTTQPVAGTQQTILVFLVSINIGLAVFNMIPFPPLDGSRVLYAIAPDFLRDIMLKIEQFGFSAILLFMFVFYPLISSYLLSINRWILDLFL